VCCSEMQCVAVCCSVLQSRGVVPYLFSPASLKTAFCSHAGTKSKTTKPTHPHMCDIHGFVTYICDIYIMCGCVDSWHISHFEKTSHCLIHMCDMTYSYVRHDYFTCATRLIHVCGMTQSRMRHDSFHCLKKTFHCLIHMCDMTYSYVRHDYFACLSLYIHPQIHTPTHSHTWISLTCTKCSLFICAT